ncbi:LytS/YhcK type 5TM receptor domain-containing protein [Methanorbis rubei]
MTLIGFNLGFAALLGIALGRSGLLDNMKGDFTDWIRYSIGIVLFGIMSLVGSIASIQYEGAMLNVRDGGPIYGGLWFGPIIGIGAAIIGSVYRFSLGGATVIPCCLATIIAGVVSGIIWYFYREKITVVIATLIAVGLSIVHIVLLILLTPNNFGWYLVSETPTGIGILILVPLSVLIFSWCYQRSKQAVAKKQ